MEIEVDQPTATTFLLLPSSPNGEYPDIVATDVTISRPESIFPVFAPLRTTVPDDYNFMAPPPLGIGPSEWSQTEKEVVDLGTPQRKCTMRSAWETPQTAIKIPRAGSASGSGTSQTVLRIKNSTSNPVDPSSTHDKNGEMGPPSPSRKTTTSSTTTTRTQISTARSSRSTPRKKKKTTAVFKLFEPVLAGPRPSHKIVPDDYKYTASSLTTPSDWSQQDTPVTTIKTTMHGARDSALQTPGARTIQITPKAAAAIRVLKTPETASKISSSHARPSPTVHSEYTNMSTLSSSSSSSIDRNAKTSTRTPNSGCGARSSPQKPSPSTPHTTGPSPTVRSVLASLGGCAYITRDKRMGFKSFKPGPLLSSPIIGTKPSKSIPTPSDASTPQKRIAINVYPFHHTPHAHKLKLPVAAIPRPAVVALQRFFESPGAWVFVINNTGGSQFLAQKLVAYQYWPERVFSDRNGEVNYRWALAVAGVYWVPWQRRMVAEGVKMAKKMGTRVPEEVYAILEREEEEEEEEKKGWEREAKAVGKGGWRKRGVEKLVGREEGLNKEEKKMKKARIEVPVEEELMEAKVEEVVGVMWEGYGRKRRWEQQQEEEKEEKEEEEEKNGEEGLMPPASKRLRRS